MSPGDGTLAGEPGGLGIPASRPVVYLACLTCKWYGELIDFPPGCPNDVNHPIERVSAHLRCRKCPWEKWSETPVDCPKSAPEDPHDVEILEFVRI